MRRLQIAAARAAALAPSLADAPSRTRLTVYTALENEQLAPFKAAAERAMPRIEIAWVRDSTGVTAKAGGAHDRDDGQDRDTCRRGRARRP